MHGGEKAMATEKEVKEQQRETADSLLAAVALLEEEKTQSLEGEAEKGGSGDEVVDGGGDIVWAGKGIPVDGSQNEQVGGGRW